MAETKVSLVDTPQAVESLRNSDFDTCSAVGEVVDNSIQANAKNIAIKTQEVELPVRGRRKEGTRKIVKIAFGDDGYGMDNETLHHCMQLGYSTRYNDRSGIGRFGVGMTLAAINQCKRIEVYSKQDGESNWRYTHVDLDNDKHYIPTPFEKDLPDEYIDMVGSKSGTLVIWDKCDRLAGSIDEIHEWVARTYRKFIGKHIVKGGKVIKNPSPVSIKINGVKIEAFDPLYAIPNPIFPEGTTAEVLVPPIEFEMPIISEAGVKEKTSKVRITLSLTPESWRMKGSGESGRSDLAKNLKISENEGFSVLRAGREVFYDVMPRFEPKVHPDGIDRWWSAEISFDPVLDNYFCVRNIKRGARFVQHLRQKIQEKMAPTILECRKQVRKRWDQTKVEEQTGDSKVSDEHNEAESVVKNVKPPVSQKEKDKSEEEKKQEIKETLEAIVNEDILEEWMAKIEAQPCTIIDNEGSRWKGSTFIDIHPKGGKTIIEYNRSHDFFLLIYEAIKDLEGYKAGKDVDSVLQRAKQLKAATDLLLMAYSQAEALLGDLGQEQKIGETIEFLKNNWGHFLRQFVKEYTKGD